jgi:hypothetical protein
MTTLARVPFALALLLAAACGPELSERTESRAGEACDYTESVAPCMLEGVDGDEFCGYDAELAEMVWSACMTETCEAGEQRACEGGGTQYCVAQWDEVETVYRWGSACVVEAECTPGERRACFGEGEFGENGPTQGCYPDINGVPAWGIEDCNTPLVLSFDRAPVRFSAPAAAAAFDVAGAGACTQPHWPSAETPWLAIDLDKNGAIDGGAELFGTGSRLAGGRADNGFVALAALDSDGDRRITPADARWGELLVWSDHDGDRRSSGWELLPAGDLALESIDLEWQDRRACDGAGNCAVERASFRFRDDRGARTGEVVDVHLACE